MFCRSCLQLDVSPGGECIALVIQEGVNAGGLTVSCQQFALSDKKVIKSMDCSKSSWVIKSL